MNAVGWDEMRLNSNCIGFENTVDYCSRMVNEIHQYCSQQTLTVFTVHDCSYFLEKIQLILFVPLNLIISH